MSDIDDLKKLADIFDKDGLFKEADYITEVIENFKFAQYDPARGGLDDPSYPIRRRTSPSLNQIPRTTKDIKLEKIAPDIVSIVSLDGKILKIPKNLVVMVSASMFLPPSEVLKIAKTDSSKFLKTLIQNQDRFSDEVLQNINKYFREQSFKDSKGEILQLTNKNRNTVLKTLTSKYLPTISKLLKQLGDALKKFDESKLGKGLNTALLINSVFSAWNNTLAVLSAVENDEEIPIYNLSQAVLGIVSIVTNSVLHSYISAIPGLGPLMGLVLNNPEVKKWMAIVNASANVLSLSVNVAHSLGTFAGTTSSFDKELEDFAKQNPDKYLSTIPFSINRLKTEFGEVYNALIDVEKGQKRLQATDNNFGTDPSRALYNAYFTSFLTNKEALQSEGVYPNANTPKVKTRAQKKAEEAKRKEQDRLKQQESKDKQTEKSYLPETLYAPKKSSDGKFLYQ